MGKIAWLVISDLHLYYKNISSRVDYVGEMRSVREQIIKIANEYRIAERRVNLLLLGDVFHRSYRDTFLGVYDNNFFVWWNKEFGDVFSVIGNHELHFYASNPFFTLVNTIESEKIRRITDSIWTPQGLLPTVRVVDRLEDGEVVFHFNHYSTPISKAEPNKVNVGLFHQEIVSNEIVNMMQERVGQKIWADTVDFTNLTVFDGYQYCFLGHMHMIYGAFKTDHSTVVYYLASLGRTTSAEVSDNFLERCIPAVLTKDGKFEGVEENNLVLLKRAKCLYEDIVRETKEKYKIEKERKIARSYDVAGDNPLENLASYFCNDPASLTIVKELSERPIDDVSLDLQKRFSRLIGGR